MFLPKVFKRFSFWNCHVIEKTGGPNQYSWRKRLQYQHPHCCCISWTRYWIYVQLDRFYFIVPKQIVRAVVIHTALLVLTLGVNSSIWSSHRIEWLLVEVTNTDCCPRSNKDNIYWLKKCWQTFEMPAWAKHKMPMQLSMLSFGKGAQNRYLSAEQLWK